MKELCIDARMVNASGIGTYLRNLLPYFDNQYKLILLGRENEISPLKLKSASIIETVSGIYSLKEQFELPFKIPKSDLFWSPHYNIPLFPIRTKKRIVTIHDAFHLHYFSTLSFPQKVYAKVFPKSAAMMSENIITVSHFSKKELIKYLNIPEEKIHVVYNGVSEDFRIIDDIEVKKSTAKKFNLPEKFILFVGNVKPHKNIKNLIKAFALLKKEKQANELKLVVAGKRKGLITSAEGLDQLVQNSGLESDIIFLENLGRGDLPVIYNLATLLVFPSFYEGFGLPPLEAMKCGCPSILSDIEPLKEIYGNDNIYVAPSDPENIKNGIQALITDELLRKKMIKSGMEFAKKYSWEASANNHLHIFEKFFK